MVRFDLAEFILIEVIFSSYHWHYISYIIIFLNYTIYLSKLNFID